MIQPFTVEGVTFRCVVEEDGCYAWQSDCGRYRAKRTGRRYEAFSNGRRVGIEPSDLRDAMRVAVHYKARAHDRPLN